jgi:hypothetical protein
MLGATVQPDLAFLKFHHNIVFEKNASFLLRMPKIAENCDHNIDPRFEIRGGLHYGQGDQIG